MAEDDFTLAWTFTREEAEEYMREHSHHKLFKIRLDDYTWRKMKDEFVNRFEKFLVDIKEGMYTVVDEVNDEKEDLEEMQGRVKKKGKEKGKNAMKVMKGKNAMKVMKGKNAMKAMK